MGAVFRFYRCASCGKRVRSAAVECGCGSTALEPSEAWYIRYRSQGRNIEEKVGSKILAREVLKEREREVTGGPHGSVFYK